MLFIIVKIVAIDRDIIARYIYIYIYLFVYYYLHSLFS